MADARVRFVPMVFAHPAACNDLATARVPRLPIIEPEPAALLANVVHNSLEEMAFLNTHTALSRAAD